MTKMTKSKKAKKSSKRTKKRVGNTKNSSSKTDERTRNWCFTLFDYTKWDIIELRDDRNKYTFQEEVCPTTGRPHLQGFTVFNDKQSFEQMKVYHPRAHWLKMGGGIGSNIHYCTKERTSTGKMYSNMTKVIKYIESKKPADQKLREFNAKLKMFIEEDSKKPIENKNPYMIMMDELNYFFEMEKLKADIANGL